ncbi:major histocompatibility complex class I-related gene protein-like isoform X2 [Heterodontus francisci]|uniref:major histocompatibility complex class I-related gene protein-like isoform X2 n=1 Tax=Heterodontus francisci TaxID=7792 RepID=UPI00355C632F
MAGRNRHTAGFHFIVLSLCSALAVCAGSHTLMSRYIYSTPLLGLPELSVVRMLDDLQTQYYDSNLKKSVPRQLWMVDNFTDDYWVQQTKTANALQQLLSTVTYLQGLWSCTQYNNNSTIGFVKIYTGMLGEIECDTATMHCKAEGIFSMLQNEFQQMLTTDITFIKSLREGCIQNLQKTLAAGKAALERKVAPQVLLFQRNFTGGVPRTLLCLITAFYPRAINATWLRNDEPVSDHLSVTVLPNHDATYRMEILINIEGIGANDYSCQVQHSSLSKTLIVRSESGGSNEIISPGPVLGLLAVLAIIAGEV